VTALAHNSYVFQKIVAPYGIVCHGFLDAVIMSYVREHTLHFKLPLKKLPHPYDSIHIIKVNCALIDALSVRSSILGKFEEVGVQWYCPPAV
jgi:hypothetical protein